MSESIELARREVWQAADGMAQASARLLEYRIARAASLSDAQAAQLEQLENELDQMVVLLRSRGVQLIGAGAAEAAAGLMGAIRLGREALGQMSDVNSLIRAASSLFDLAVALLGRNPGPALKAIRTLHELADEQGLV